jgi:nitrogen fixation protein FixH
MAAIRVCFFAVVLTVNLVMARFAIGSFGGEVVENSYVASQHFNRWLDEAAAEQALGWKAQITRRGDHRLSVRLVGVAVETVALAGTARHPLGAQPEQILQFVRTRDGRFLSTTPLPTGRWLIRLEVRARGHRWRHEEDLR